MRWPWPRHGFCRDGYLPRRHGNEGDSSAVEWRGAVVYTILGAWDTNPEKHIVSYLSQVGKELTGKSVGDQVKIVPMDGDKKKVYTITKIEAAF